MIANATVSWNYAKSAALALVLLSAPAAALAAGGGNVRDRDPDIEDIATTPLADLNLSRDEIPEVLQQAAADPYSSEGLDGCDMIGAAIVELDGLLGADLDIATGERRDITLGRVAKSAVASFIPFRGIVRELSGAADHQRDFEEAIVAGAIRRGYLKGLGQERGCSYPARPAFTKVELTNEKRTDSEEGLAPTAGQEVPAEDGTVYHSAPVVQTIDEN